MVEGSDRTFDFKDRELNKSLSENPHCHPEERSGPREGGEGSVIDRNRSE